MFCSRNVSYNLFHYFIYYIDMDIKNICAKKYISYCTTIFFHNVTVGLFVAENSECDLLLMFMFIHIYIIHIFY